MPFLGLDLGTQSLKAMVCDERLRVLGAHAVGYDTRYPERDRVEQDPRDWEPVSYTHLTLPTSDLV